MELRRKNVFLAKAAELLDRFDDMVEHMKAVVKGGPQLTQEERNLFSVAFKRSVGDRRGAVAAVQKAAKAANAEEADSVAVFAQEYIQQLNDELEAFIATALYLLDSALIPCASDPESLVFYLKMKADYHRYMAELGFDDSYAREKARQTYGEAERLATKLPVTHPIRLAVALNYAVFLLEIMKDKEAARKKARAAYSKAIEAFDELESLDEESYKNSTLIMQLLRDAQQGPLWEEH